MASVKPRLSSILDFPKHGLKDAKENLRRKHTVHVPGLSKHQSLVILYESNPFALDSHYVQLDFSPPTSREAAFDPIGIQRTYNEIANSVPWTNLRPILNLLYSLWGETGYLQDETVQRLKRWIGSIERISIWVQY